MIQRATTTELSGSSADVAFAHFLTLPITCGFAVSSSSAASGTDTSQMERSSKVILLLYQDMGIYKPEWQICTMAEKEDACPSTRTRSSLFQFRFSLAGSTAAGRAAIHASAKCRQYCAKPQGTHAAFCSIRTAEVTLNYHTTQK